MFKIYDLNYNEISLPKDRLGYGLRGLDISIGPIIYESIYNQSNYADTLIKRYPKDRAASIRVLTVASDTIDWRIKRNELYTFFRNLGAFYVAESHEPFKLLKVIVDESYELDRPVTIWAQSDIPLKVLDTPFRQSLHTTMTIENEGMQFNGKWGYDMGTWFPENYWRYAFSNEDPTFYNAGDEAVKLIKQKDSLIELTAKEAAQWLEIVDDTGNVFRLNKAIQSGDVLRIRGNIITLNNTNVMGDTNFTFLTARRGWCRWNVRGISQFEFNIDFRYLYD